MKKLIPLFILTCLLAGCRMAGDPVAGTSHETETGNQISGILRGEDEISNANIKVYLRTANYVRPEPDSMADHPFRAWADSVKTDSQGHFLFKLGPKDTGSLILEAKRDTSMALRLPFEHPKAEFRDLGTRLLALTGALRGSILLPPDEVGTVLIQMLGSTRYLILDTGISDFSFPSLPSGSYTGRIQGLNPPRAPLDFQVEVPPGGTATLAPMTLGMSSGAIRGRILMPAGTHGSAEVQVVGTDITTQTDSLGRYYLTGLSEGTYTLRAFGRIPRRDTVEAQVKVKPQAVTTEADLQLHRLALLLIDGDNNHDWMALTRIFRAVLAAPGLFQVTVSTTPAYGSTADQWSAWTPTFSAYDAVLLNYSDVRHSTGTVWPDAAKEGLRAFVAQGGGLVVTQSSQSAFGNWEAFHEMLGLAWGDSVPYPGYYLDSANRAHIVPVGRESSYTVAGSFLIQKTAAVHPITRGLPAAWRHTTDRLDVGLRGPAKNMTVLSTFANPGNGRLEAADLTVAYGKGRVYNTVLGDIAEGGTDIAARCAGFQTLLARGAEWAATGEVTQKVPKDFPTDTLESLRPAPVP